MGAVTPAPVAGPRPRFDLIQFQVRLVITGALALAASFLEVIGDRRVAISLFLALIVIPAHYLVQRITRETNPAGWLDLVAVAAATICAIIEPALFAPALLLQMLTVGGSVAFLPSRWTSILGFGSVGSMALVALFLPVASTALPMLVVATVFLPALTVGAKQRKASELRSSEQVESLVNSLPILLWEADRESGTMRSVIGQPTRVLGMSNEQLLEDGYASRIHPADRDRFEQRIRSGSTMPLTYRFQRPDGAFRWLSDRVEDVMVRGVEMVRGVSYDVTTERLAQASMVRQSEIVERMSAATIVFDDPSMMGQATVIHLTDPLGDLVDNPKKLIGLTFNEAFPNLANQPWLVNAFRDLNRASSVDLGPHVITSTNGEDASIEVQLFTLPDGSAALIAENVTEREQASAVIRHQATHDGLTGLPNRIQLLSVMNARLDEAEPFALALIDLNRFKNINDTLGHFTGDELLRVVAQRLVSAIRSDDLVARLGGDEFAIVLHSPDADALPNRLEHITAACREKVSIAGSVVATGASIGVALAPEHGDDPESILRFADIAMYEAKRSNNSVRFYEPGRTKVPEHLDLMAELGAAFAEGQFQPYFQPKLLLESGHIAGAEALARWHHPERGIIMPGEFIELVLLAGQLDDLLHQMLWSTLRTLVKLPNDCTMALNLSAVNLRRSDLASTIEQALSAHEIDPGRIIVELTESELMDETGVLHRSLHDLAELGLGVSVDDFGTGYSSLAHLRSLPLTELKIDQRFVGGMTTNRHDLVIVKALVDLGHNLDLQVTAEGVADEATRVMLRDLGCDKAQGYLLGRPMPAADFIALANDQRTATKLAEAPAPAPAPGA